MPFIDDDAPKAPRKLAVVKTHGKNVLFWTAPKGSGWKNGAHQYVVYRFSPNEKTDLSRPDRIVAITPNTFYELTSNQPATYVVTALDRMGNESKGAVKKIKR